MEHSMDREVAVPLTDRDFVDSGRRLAELIAERDRLELDKDVRMKACNKAIALKESEISELAKSLREGFASARQGDLFHDDARKALHDVVSYAERSGAQGSEAFNFDDKEPAPSVVATHPAVDVDKADRDEPEDGSKKRGGRKRTEAGGTA